MALLLALAVATGCGRAGAVSRWVAEIDTIGDTIVVRTLSGGIWADEGRLVSDLRIGELEGQDEYLLGNVSGLAVGPAGEMYIYDSQGPALRSVIELNPDALAIADRLNLDLFAESHPIAGEPHFRQDVAPEDPHSGLRVADPSQEQHRHGKR